MSETTSSPTPRKPRVTTFGGNSHALPQAPASTAPSAFSAAHHATEAPPTDRTLSTDSHPVNEFVDSSPEARGYGAG
jgi:hypothetical protein